MKPRHQRMRRPLLAIVTIAGLGALAFAAAVSLGAAGRDADDHSVLFTQSAAGGSLKPSGGDRMTLTLHGVAPQVVWFQDRPDRRAGHMSAPAFVSRWRSFGFQSDAPNAALTLLDATHNADTVVVEVLRSPRYNPIRQTMTYVVRRLSETSGKLARFEDDADVRVPEQFAAASLFIDTADGQQVTAHPREMGAEWVLDVFASNTQVSLPDGGRKRIGDTQVGDEVMSVDANGKPTSATVRFSQCAPPGENRMLYLRYGENQNPQTLIAQSNSLFYNGQRADQLVPGKDDLAGLSGQTWPLDTIAVGEYNGGICGIKVDGTGWYFVNGVLADGHPQI